MSQDNLEFKLLNIDSVRESLKLVSLNLEKSVKGGLLNLDEAYLTKVALNNLVESTESLDKLQNFIITLQKNKQQTQKNQ